MAKTIRTICCQCKGLIHDGPMPNGQPSHGLCRHCFIRTMRSIGASEQDIRQALDQIDQQKVTNCSGFIPTGTFDEPAVSEFEEPQNL